MKLEGSLDAFALPDVLGLLRSTGKSGAVELQLDDGFDGVVLHLVDGDLAGAERRGARLDLLRGLVMVGIVDEDAIAEAATHAAGTGAGLVSSLVSLGLVAAETATDHAAAVVVEHLVRALRATGGTFAFDPSVQAEDDIGLRMPVTEAIAVATGSLAAWREAAAILDPSGTAVDGAVPSPAAQVTGAIELENDDWLLLRLADGRRPVHEIVDLAGTGIVRTTTALASLVRRGLLVASAADEDPVVDRVARRDLMRLLDDAARSADAAPTGAAATAAQDAPARPTEPPIGPPPAPTGADAAEGVDRTVVMRLISGVGQL